MIRARISVVLRLVSQILCAPCSSVEQDPKLLRGVPDEEGNKLPRDVAGKVQNILKIFGLQNAAQTIVGNDMIRGVSGGEKKRVTLAEMMMGNHRVLLLGQCCLVACVCRTGVSCGAGFQTTSARVLTVRPPKISWKPAALAVVNWASPVLLRCCNRLQRCWRCSTVSC